MAWKEKVLTVLPQLISTIFPHFTPDISSSKSKLTSYFQSSVFSTLLCSFLKTGGVLSSETRLICVLTVFVAPASSIAVIAISFEAKISVLLSIKDFTVVQSKVIFTFLIGSGDLIL